jgi:isopentenyl phosphate kinase
MLTLIKLGGSLITNKQLEKSFRRDVVKRLADEIAAAYAEDPTNQLIIGHGSGSFGHFAASRANTIKGVQSADDWKAFAHVGNTAAELNYLVCDCLQSAGLPVWRLQPSASLMAEDGKVSSMSLTAIETAISHGLIPLLYGDVSIDSMLGGTIISTEKLFFYLCSQLPVNRVFLLGEVSGVYDSHGTVISAITNTNYGNFNSVLGGSAGTDVTGGMETKVEEMLDVVKANPNVTIRIMSGLETNLLKDALIANVDSGTLIAR